MEARQQRGELKDSAIPSCPKATTHKHVVFHFSIRRADQIDPEGHQAGLVLRKILLLLRIAHAALLNVRQGQAKASLGGFLVCADRIRTCRPSSSVLQRAEIRRLPLPNRANTSGQFVDTFWPNRIYTILDERKSVEREKDPHSLYSCGFKSSGQEWIRTTEGVSQRIYSTIEPTRQP